MTSAGLRSSIIGIVLLCSIESAGAQSLAVGAVGTTGLTIQPVDSTYVGPEGPYLKSGLGGVGGPVASVGVHTSIEQFVVLGEVSYSAVSKDLVGRLVPGGGGDGRVRDTALSLLVGPQLPVGRARLNVLGGLSRVFSDVSVDGVTIDAKPVSLRRSAFTFGLDVLSPAGRRIDYVGGLRVTPGIERSERSRELGVGRTIVRLAFGVRVALAGR
jgi:hypothetical protein